MLAPMPTLARRSTPLFVFLLMLGATAPAYADIESGTPKQDMPAEDNNDDGKSGGCSVETPKLELAGLAGLVLLISGAALRRRRG